MIYNMKTTEYYIKARLFPTILCAFPILILYYFGFKDIVIGFAGFLEGYKWVGSITISIAVVYLMSLVNRFVAKELFQKIYSKDEQEMPTTNRLLHSNTFFAQNTKKRIHNKIKESFDIELFTKSQELENEVEARKIIIEAVSQIRNATRDNQLLFQHNIEYGFARNFVGGSFIPFIVSCINIYFFYFVIKNPVAFNISIMCLVIFLFTLILSKYLVKRFGKYYAKILFEQFLQN